MALVEAEKREHPRTHWADLFYSEILASVYGFPVFPWNGEQKMDGVTEYLRDHAYRQHFACRARVFQTISLAEPGAEPTASVEALHRDVLILGVERLGSFAELEGRFIALVHSTDDRNWQKDEGTATVH